jgi:hypothetical protein
MPTAEERANQEIERASQAKDRANREKEWVA